MSKDLYPEQDDRGELKRLTTPVTSGPSTDPTSAAVQFMRSLFTWRAPKAGGKQYQIVDPRGRHRVKWLTDDEADELREQGHALTLVKDLPGKPVLVDDHEQRVNKSFGQGYVSHKLTHNKFGKKWYGKRKTGKASLQTHIMYRRYSSDGKTFVQYRLPRKEE